MNKAGITKERRWERVSTGLRFKPRILGFVCHWLGYGAADMSGVSRLQYTPEMRLIRVMCTGRVDLEFVLRAFSNGMDGVFIGGCRLNECNYVTQGNYHALTMTLLCRRIMEHLGLNPERLSIEFMSAGEGIRFAEVVNDFATKVKALGPLGTAEEIDRLFREVVSYYIEPDKCTACMICARRCPVEAIASVKNQVHVIDQEECIKCGVCFEVCPPRFGAVMNLSG